MSRGRHPVHIARLERGGDARLIAHSPPRGTHHRHRLGALSAAHRALRLVQPRAHRVYVCRVASSLLSRERPGSYDGRRRQRTRVSWYGRPIEKHAAIVLICRPEGLRMLFASVVLPVRVRMLFASVVLLVSV